MTRIPSIRTHLGGRSSSALAFGLALLTGLCACSPGSRSDTNDSSLLGSGVNQADRDGVTNLAQTGVQTIVIPGPEGGPFPDGRRTYALPNPSNHRVRWFLESEENWLDADATSGEIDARSRTEITISVNQAIAAGLPVGDYPADIVYRDQANPGGVPYRRFVLSVQAPPPIDARLAVTPLEDFHTTGVAGQSVQQLEMTYTLSNVGDRPLDYLVDSDQDWVLISPGDTGTLDANTSVDITLTLAAEVWQDFPAGNHLAAVDFENNTNGDGNTTRTVRVELTNGGGQQDNRVSDGVQVLYTFEEMSGGVVHDLSGVQPALDLSVDGSSSGSPQWQPGSMILDGNVLLATSGSAQRLSQSIQQSNQLTIEAWIDPLHLSQSGPARILTLSDGANERNFTLGQGMWGSNPMDTFNVRLRSSATDLDGMPLVTTDAGSAETDLQHVVYTRGTNGAVSFFINGELVKTGSVGGDLGNWDSNFRLGVGNEFDADRPWLGSVHLLAVFDRALSESEIDQNFAAGPQDQGAGRLAITPDFDFYVSVDADGAISQTSMTYTLSNVGDEALSWSASQVSSWLTLPGATSGTLAAGQTADVLVRVDEDEAVAMAPGYYSAQVDFVNTTNDFGSSSRDILLSVQDGSGGPGGAVQMDYFEKSSGSLDYMGVQITRSQGSQHLWAPGSPAQEFPGGWVTPGTYTLGLNPGRIHGKFDGVHTGVTRSGDQMVGVVIHKDLTWGGWSNWSYTGHPDCAFENWGTSKTITLQPGDTVHVGYGTPVPMLWGTRQGSDGVVFYCVESEPQPRGGLWGTGYLGFDGELWNTLRERVIQSAQATETSTEYYNWGPEDGTMPAVLPSDLGQMPGDLENQQSVTIGRWLMNRGFHRIKNGPNSINMQEFDRLFRYFFQNIQTWGSWGEDVTAMDFMSHGIPRYAPYFIQNSVLPALVAAVALEYDPSYEPMYRILSDLAQRVDMNLSHGSCYSHGNADSEGGLSAHRDDNSFTQWQWYTIGATDMTAKASHRMGVWAPCYWARVLLRYPQTSVQAVTLSSVGPRFTNPDGTPGAWEGHEWSEDGAGPGWHLFYAQVEMRGAQWLWFSGLERDSQLVRFARRSILADDGYGSYYSNWTADRFVGEPRHPHGQIQGGSPSLGWDAVSGNGFHHYRVYRASHTGGGFSVLADNVASNSFQDTTADEGTGYTYRVCAVRSDGECSSLSDPVSITP